ncbi:MAG: hypothetical protein U1A27_13170 [Phycisphaerae bacterium]
MYPGQMEPVAYRPRVGIMVTLLKGLTTVAVTGLLCATGLASYGLVVFNQQAHQLGRLGGAALQGLPEFMSSLPPVFADMVHDQREPEYLKHVTITSKLVAEGERGEVFRPVLEVKNDGPDVISLMSVHVALMSPEGAPLVERTEYVAAPVASKDDSMRGPLMPGATRHIRCELLSRKATRTLACDVSELRVWRRGAAEGHAGSAARTTERSAERDSDGEKLES